MTKKDKVRFTKKEKSQIELGVMLLAAMLSIFLWDSVVLYPIKLFVVMLHEISHGIAVLLTGGKINYIQFSDNLGGGCIAEGGVKFIIASAGYIGSLAAGSLLFIYSYNKKKITILNSVLAVLLILFAVNYFNQPVNIYFALLISIFLLVSPKYFHPAVNSYLMRILGLISSLYVLTDIKEDLLTLTYRETDAQILEQLTSIPAIFWGIIWFALTVVVVYYLFKYSYKIGVKF